jgi:hypothetical protein
MENTCNKMLVAMKNTIFVSLLTLFTYACGSGHDGGHTKGGKTFRMTLNGDTCNVVDENGKKQGVWYTFDNSVNPPAITATVTYKDGIEVK